MSQTISDNTNLSNDTSLEKYAVLFGWTEIWQPYAQMLARRTICDLVFTVKTSSLVNRVKRVELLHILT